MKRWILAVVTLGVLGLAIGWIWVIGVSESGTLSLDTTMGDFQTKVEPSLETEPLPNDRLWRVVDENKVTQKPHFHASWAERGRKLVDVSNAVAMSRTWQVGDLVGIDIPQLHMQLNGYIERIETGPAGASSARGLVIDEDGLERRFVVTVGPRRVFAYVDTPDDSYELAGNERLAWLLPTSSLLAGIDFSKPDYRFPSEEVAHSDED